ncbi:hypothetical protein D6779_04550 [Candidatus Parcubacteria bacterium]|nr:MAG: hypothetical protein D6779_04550 [Candidatus Parcubacteria bacterium]
MYRYETLTIPQMMEMVTHHITILHLNIIRSREIDQQSWRRKKSVAPGRISISKHSATAQIKFEHPDERITLWLTPSLNRERKLADLFHESLKKAVIETDMLPMPENPVDFCIVPSPKTVSVELWYHDLPEKRIKKRLPKEIGRTLDELQEKQNIHDLIELDITSRHLSRIASAFGYVDQTINSLTTEEINDFWREHKERITAMLEAGQHLLKRHKKVIAEIHPPFEEKVRTHLNSIESVLMRFPTEKQPQNP